MMDCSVRFLERSTTSKLQVSKSSKYNCSTWCRTTQVRKYLVEVPMFQNDIGTNSVILSLWRSISKRYVNDSWHRFIVRSSRSSTLQSTEKAKTFVLKTQQLWTSWWQMSITSTVIVIRPPTRWNMNVTFLKTTFDLRVCWSRCI